MNAFIPTGSRAAAVSLALGGALLAGGAQAVPILSFGQTGNANTITGVRTGSTTTISASNSAITISQIDAAMAAPLPAFLTFSFASTSAATTLGTNIVQDFAGTFCITSAAGCGGINYLSGSLVDVAFGSNASFNLTASTPPSGNVTFTSSVIADLGLDRGAGFAFADVSPLLHITSNTIDSFSSSVSGTFSAVAAPVPEPETYALLLAGLTAVGLISRRRRFGRRA